MAKSLGNWRNTSIVDVSDSDEDLVESSFVTKSLECVIPSSPESELNDSIVIRSRKKQIIPLSDDDDDDDVVDEEISYSEKSINESSTSNVAVIDEKNGSGRKIHEENLSSIAKPSELDHPVNSPSEFINFNQFEYVKEEEENEICDLKSQNFPLYDKSTYLEEIYNADSSLLDADTKSAILESVHNSLDTDYEEKRRSSLQLKVEDTINFNSDNVHNDHYVNNLEKSSLPSNNDKGDDNRDEYKGTLLAEKMRLECEIESVKTSIRNKNSTLNTVNVDVLPDKGMRIKISLQREVRSLDSLNEQLDRVNKKIESDFKDAIKKLEKSDNKALKFDSLPSANLQEMGEKALETHRIEQALTVDALQNLHSSLKSCPSDNEIATDPVGLKVPLMIHQRQALAWLAWREKEKPSGGILADDMGLGKTLTMISFILKCNEGSENDDSTTIDDDDDDFIENKKKYKGGTLIVCPSSLIGQWEHEIRHKLRHDLLTYEVHHGQKREKKARRLTRFNIVITTYAIARVEFQKFSEHDGSMCTLFQIGWKRIILDEAHVIRNHQSLTAKAIFELKACYRWALTGTPVHNKAQDFFALIKFLRCKPFNDIAVWKKWVEAKDITGTKRLNMLTKSLMLRRTKNVLINEGKLQSLPEKSTEIIMVHLHKDEWTLYEAVSNFSKSLLSQLLYQRAEKQDLLTNGIQIKNKMVEDGNPFNKHPALNRLYNRLVNMKNVKTHEILVLLLRLRQICCHPVLMKSMIEKEVFVQDGIEDDGLDIDLLEKMSSMAVNDGAENENNQAESLQNNVLDPNSNIFKPEWQSSKIQAIMHLIEYSLLKTDDKIVIVSQWPSMLDLISNFLKKFKNCKCECLTGKVPVDKRMAIVSEFNSRSSVKILLLSLTAGGTGLNLVGGNHLILTDLHWNPQQEAQACDRIYRVGQKKPVKIYKFVCAETIEERIQQLQTNKLALADGILSGAKQLQVGKLSLNDLKMLFNVT